VVAGLRRLVRALRAVVELAALLAALAAIGARVLLVLAEMRWRWWRARRAAEHELRKAGVGCIEELAEVCVGPKPTLSMLGALIGGIRARGKEAR